MWSHTGPHTNVIVLGSHQFASGKVARNDVPAGKQASIPLQAFLEQLLWCAGSELNKEILS